MIHVTVCYGENSTDIEFPCPEHYLQSKLEEVEEKYDVVVEELGEEVVERIVERNQELECEKQHYFESR